jgi:phage terminase large subunit-like protein
MPSDFWKQPVAGFDPWACDTDYYYFDEDVAQAVCDFFPTYLTHDQSTTGVEAGSPFYLEDWEKRFVGNLFGWKRKSDGYRRFNEGFLYIPKKNGKTPIVAGIGLLLLTADGEDGAEVYTAAGDRDQARLIFDFAEHSIRGNPTLNDHLEVYTGYKSMKYAPTQSYLKVLSSEVKTKHGPKPHGIIIDELHVQDTWDLVDTLLRGTASRRQPLVLYCTTADYDRESPCNEMLERAKNVRDGVIDDPHLFPVIYGASEEDDWTAPETWRKANPNLGVTVSEDYLDREVKKAQNSKSKESSFKRLHLNIQTKLQQKWLELSEWDASGRDIKPEQLDKENCYITVDLGQTRDISCIGYYFPEWKAYLLDCYCPRQTIDSKIEYQQWEKQGFIKEAGDKTCDYEFLRSDIQTASEKYKILDIGYDPWNAAEMARKLSDEDGLPVIEMRQGFKTLNEPSKRLEEEIAAKEITHFGNPVLRWMAQNTQVREDPAGNIKPEKPNRNSPQKIDGIVTLVMGIGLAINAEGEEDGQSVYEQRGLVQL